MKKDLNYIKIRESQLVDCLSIAKIHKEYLNRSFLGTLGERGLTLLYKTLVEYEESILIVAENNGKVIGFISGSMNVGDLYKYFLKRNSLKAFFFLLPRFINVSIVKKVLETLRYPKRDLEISLPEADLLSIAVMEDYQGKGISKQLFKALVNEFDKRGTSEFKIIVGTSLSRSQKFYKNLGCINFGKFELHKGEKSEVYVFKG